MSTPQIIYIVLITTNITVNLIKHGEEISVKYSVWRALVFSGIQIALLKWGGFF